MLAIIVSVFFALSVVHMAVKQHLSTGVFYQFEGATSSKLLICKFVPEKSKLIFAGTNILLTGNQQ
jgi:hypothetical protein